MEKSLARFAFRHPRGINFVYAARDQWLQNLPIICVIGSFCCSPPAWHKLRLCCTRPMAAKLADNMCVIGSFCCSPPMAAKLADNMYVIGSFCCSPPMAAKLADNMCVIGSFCCSPPMAAKLADNMCVIVLQLPRHRQCGRIRPLSPGRRASVLL